MHNMEDVKMGSRIKKIRLMRELTQKQLGDRVGLSDVRIRQYEMGIRRPKDDMLVKIARALDVNADAISAPAITSHFQSLQTLFMMEDHLGAHPVRVNGNYYISFYEDDENPHLGNISTEGIQLWCERLEEYRKILTETPGQAEDAKKEYDLWRYRYPMDNAEKTSKQIRRMMRIDQLREELARLEEEDREDR